MIQLTIRNMRLFLRDKSAVFFSLLSVLIIIGLYALFLKNTIIRSLEGVSSASFLINSWVMAGILAVGTVTTSLGSFGIMVDDCSNGIVKDFYTAPFKRWKIAVSYMINSWLVGIIICLVTFVVAEVYIVLNDGKILDFNGILLMMLLILLGVISSSSIVFFMVSFFKSHNAFATASTVIGTLIGFLMGIYIPLGSLPSVAQMVIKLFPISHLAVLMRQVLLEKPLEESFAQTPINILEDFKSDFGVVYYFSSEEVSVLTSVLVLVGCSILFYGLAIFNLSRKLK